MRGKKQRDQRRATAWSAPALQLRTTLQRATLPCCEAAVRVAAALQLVVPRCCRLQRCDAVALQRTTLRCCTGCCGATQVVATLRRGSRSWCCDSTALQQLGCCDSAALQQLAVLRRCGAAAARGAETLWRYSNSRCCDAAALQQLWLLLFFFFFNDSWQVLLYLQEREKQRARENKRKL